MYYRFKIEKQATSKATLNLKYGKLPNNVRYQTFVSQGHQMTDSLIQELYHRSAKKQ